MRRVALVCCCALSLLAALTPHAGASATPSASEARHLQARAGHIVDGLGRTVLLRGVNVNQLGDYFQPNLDVPSTLPFSRRDLERIAALGLNSVRLLVHWSRLEPSPGVHDDAYLGQVQQAVTWARELGLYVVLDMHQDAWGKYIASPRDGSCPPGMTPNPGWDGAPEWATITDALPRCKEQIREASPAVADAWQSFWVDRPAPSGPSSGGRGIQQHLVDTWAWLAHAFRADPTVVGYDLLNEPNPGFALGVTDVTTLGLYYQRALTAIRAAETGGLRKIVFFEPPATWSATSIGVPRPWTTDTQIVYAPHIYTGSLNADRSVTGREVVPLRQGFEEAKREAAAYGTTFWSGEWGSWFGSEAADGAYAARFAALEDEFQVGSAFWQWKQSCGDPHSAAYPSGAVPDEVGNLVRVRCGDPQQPAGVDIGLVDPNAQVLSRPYPRAFPGSVTFTSDPATRTLVLQGSGATDGAPLDVWVPGTARPEVDTSGLSSVRLHSVTGGWRLTARPAAASWRLRAAGS